MKTLRLDTTELGLDFNAALKLATGIARQQLDEDTMLLSWYDRERDLESPAGVSECHLGWRDRPAALDEDTMLLSWYDRERDLCRPA